MKRISIISLLLLAILSVDAQETKKIDVKLYGFIRNEAFLDTYKGLNAANELFYLFPLYTGVDDNGDHLNKQLSSNLSSMATRFGIAVSGPDFFSAKTSGVLETDFAGNPANLTALLRIRKAYIKFDWEKSSLLVGQTWHPFWTGSIFPTVGSLNTGAPFQPFNRSPQARFDYKLGEKISLNASAVYEYQYLSAGPSGKTDQYTRNAVIPELVGGVEAKAGDLTLGVMASLKQIKPRQFNVVGEQTFISKDLVQSAALLGYVQYKSGKFVARAKSIIGQNLGYLLMPSGYGVSAYNTGTGETSYTSYNNSYSFVNAVYGKKWQFGFYAGYGLNLGTTDALLDLNAASSSMERQKTEVYGMLPGIQSMYRVSPHVALNAGKVRLVLEYERTGVDFGSGTMNLNDGLYNSATTAVNDRVLFVMMYFF